MKKRCPQCDMDVRTADYYRHPKTADRLMAICKACHRSNVRANYQRNREHFREYERGRANLPHRVEAREAYARTPVGREAQAKSNKAWASRNSIKRHAQIACGNAIRDGRLIRQPCEVCGEVKSQAHHDDYGKPLDVRWLCTKHHAEWHRHNTPKVPEQHAA